jgi:hypothetical protein
VDGERTHRIWPYVVISSAGFLVLATVFTLILRAGNFGAGHGCHFDRAAWTEARGAYDRAKPLAEDLVNCDGILYGHSRAQVQSLLGPRDFKARHGWGYDIGVPDGLSDYPGLQVEFGQDGKVKEVSVPAYIERD